MEERVLIESLSPIERDLFVHIKREYLDIEKIAKEAGQDRTTAIRAVNFLKNKGLLEEKTSNKKSVILGILGLNYSKKELPERVLLNKLEQKKTIPIGEIKNVCGLNDNESKIALGILRKKNLIKIDGGRIHLDARPEEITNKMIEELFLEKLPLPLEE
ncbi:MAG: hypothetical protein Q8P15_03965, partial [Nanoarchaeota archaeon]|nr:hypothetical protein [Nanoarchaeota archaeon]